jgi:hypothetical protein
VPANEVTIMPAWFRIERLGITLRVVALAALLCVAAAPLDQAASPAANVVFQLQSSMGSSLSLLTDFTSTSDPEGLLGRPGGYVAKASFNDTSASASRDQVSGAVEVFASISDLNNRLATMHLAPYEQDVTSGTILVRLYGPTPERAADYQAALATVVLS